MGRRRFGFGTNGVQLGGAVAGARMHSQGTYFGVSDNSVSKDVEKTGDEFFASLDVNMRCRALSGIYVKVVREYGVDSSSTIDVKRRLVKYCPQRYCKVIEEVENSSPKLSSDRAAARLPSHNGVYNYSVYEDDEKSADEFFGSLDVYMRCRALSSIYEKAVREGRLDSRSAIHVKRHLVKYCPEKYRKVIQEVENSSSKSPSDSVQS